MMDWLQFAGLLVAIVGSAVGASVKVSSSLAALKSELGELRRDVDRITASQDRQGERIGSLDVALGGIQRVCAERHKDRLAAL